MLEGFSTGSTFLGARFLPHPPAVGQVYATADGFPAAPLPEAAFLPVEGARLAEPCADGGLPAQLVRGLELSAAGEGGWTGEELTYDHGGRRQVLVLHNAYLFCGPDTPAEKCADVADR